MCRRASRMASASTRKGGSTPARRMASTSSIRDGTLLGKLRVPEKVGNVTFGGRERDTLYIAASTSLYRIVLRTRGVQEP